MPFSLLGQFFSVFLSVLFRGKTRRFSTGTARMVFWRRMVGMGASGGKDYTNLPHGEYAFRVEARHAYAQRSALRRFIPFAGPPALVSTTPTKVWHALLGIALCLYAQHTGRRIEKQRKALLLQAQESELRQREEAHRQEVSPPEAEIIRLRNEKLSRCPAQTSNRTRYHAPGKRRNFVEIKGLNKLLNNAAPEKQKTQTTHPKPSTRGYPPDDNWEQFELHFDQVHENF